MADKILASDLPVAIRKLEDGTEYEVGIIFQGAFHVIQKIKAGKVDRYVRVAAAKAAAAAAAAPPPAPPATPVA